MANNSGPGYAKHPEHTVTVELSKERVTVTFAGEVLADTTNALCLREAKYSPVYYIPRSDVRMDRLERTTHKTHCPFKGDASYFSIITGGPAPKRPIDNHDGKRAENAVWTYEAPFDEVNVIKEYVAFYPNKVDSITVA
jgi:uncharacterized protein (DUF427 family)